MIVFVPWRSSTSSATTPTARVGTAFLSPSATLRRTLLPAEVWGIDHGLCFAAEYKLRTVIWEFADEPISEPLLDRVNRLVDRVPLDIATLLSDDEVEAIQGRAAWCVKHRRFPDRPDRPPLSLATGLTYPSELGCHAHLFRARMLIWLMTTSMI